MKSTTTTNSPSHLSTAAILCAGFTFEGRDGFSFMNQEEWRAVVGYESLYEVSSQGRVRSLRQRNKQVNRPREVPLVKRQSAHPISRHLTCTLSKNGVLIGCGVHRIVAAAFIGPCPHGKQVAHLDGNPQNNTPANLAYVTATENQAHRRIHGTACFGQLNPNARLTDSDVIEIRRRYNAGEKAVALSKVFGTCSDNIRAVAKGVSFKHLGGIK